MIRHLWPLIQNKKGKFIFNKTFEAASDTMWIMFGRAE